MTHTTCPTCRPDQQCHECSLVAQGVHVARCGSCKAPIVWLRARSGSNMPVDSATVKPGDDAYDHTRHRAHWASCPFASEHRRAR